MKCYNCNRLIWYWNKWRNYPLIINVPTTDYGKKVYVCSEKCLNEFKDKLSNLKYICKPKNQTMKEISLFLNRGL